MNVAIVGCGYVSEFYRATLGNYPELNLIGIYDRNVANLRAFHARTPARIYQNLGELLADPALELVLNLTNPRSHFDITRQALEAGKHVYSEKPLAMTAEAAQTLVKLSRERQRYLASAPCSLLSETAQTLWQALRDNAIGRVRLVYANYDDGMVAPTMRPWTWRNAAGVAWPATDEFEVGCTYEHAGYVLTWLAAFFGPASRVASYAACLLPDKGIPVGAMAPDFVAGCIEYPDGVVARLTCGLVAPADKSLTIVGDAGVLTVADLRDDRCPVYLRALPPRRLDAAIERRVNRLRSRLGIDRRSGEWHRWTRLPSVQHRPQTVASREKPVDFCRGPAEMVDAISERRPCRLSAELGYHITELIERLQYPDRFAGTPELSSTFDPIAPLAPH